MGTDRTFYCWVKLFAVPDAEPGADLAEAGASVLNKRPPSMTRLPPGGLAAGQIDIMYKRPPYTREVAQRLAAHPDPTDLFQFSGAALAGWWDVAGGVGGQIEGGRAQAEIRAMTGSGDEAKHWIDSVEGRHWRSDAHTYFLMCFAASCGG